MFWNTFLQLQVSLISWITISYILEFIISIMQVYSQYFKLIKNNSNIYLQLVMYVT